MKRLLTTIAVLGSAVAFAPASGAATSTTKTVTIGDNFFSPRKATVKVGTTIRWRWPADGGDSHDVKLKSGPKRATRFHSEAAASGYVYKRKLTVPGTYYIICTLHEEMKETFIVKR